MSTSHQEVRSTARVLVRENVCNVQYMILCTRRPGFNQRRVDDKHTVPVTMNLLKYIFLMIAEVAFTVNAADVIQEEITLSTMHLWLLWNNISVMSLNSQDMHMEHSVLMKPLVVTRINYSEVTLYWWQDRYCGLGAWCFFMVIPEMLFFHDICKIIGLRIELFEYILHISASLFLKYTHFSQCNSGLGNIIKPLLLYLLE